MKTRVHVPSCKDNGIFSVTRLHDKFQQGELLLLDKVNTVNGTHIHRFSNPLFFIPPLM